jgi:hypothetical protein
MPANVAVTKSHYQYQNDKGTIYQVRLADYIATQVDGAGNSLIGADPAVGTEPPLPGGHLLRRAIVRDLVNKRDRTVIICKQGASLIVVPTPAGASTINLNHGVNLNTYTYQGRYLTETRGRRA